MEPLEPVSKASNELGNATVRSESATRLDSQPGTAVGSLETAGGGLDGDGGKIPPRKAGGVRGFFLEMLELVVVTLVLLIVIRWALAEARYIPSGSMEPTLQINDRLLVEKVSGHLGTPVKRGDILVFYPPPEELGHDLSNDPLTVLGRLTGLPFLPYEPAFIKRVIGLPGDHLRIQKGVGVLINGVPIDESSYVREPANYDLEFMSDICGRNANGSYINPYPGNKDPIVVPAGHLFMMGDNRNNSEDSHVWGFLDEKRIIGRAYLLFFRLLDTTKFPRFPEENQDDK